MAGRLRKPVGRRRRAGRAFAEMHHQLRTEGGTPAGTALAVWLGTTIGCTPLYGLHLPICVVLSRLLRVSRVKTYLAAHINNPLSGPLIVFLSFGVGQWMLSGHWPSLTIAELGEIGFWRLGLAVFLGGFVIGAIVGVPLAGFAYYVSKQWASSPWWTQLREEASRGYLDGAGVFAWEFVRGKLRHDPLYFALLESGELPERGTLLDLGCGRGLMLAVLKAAQAIHQRGAWPEGRRAPPQLQLRGVESRSRIAAQARAALGDAARIDVRDLTSYEPPPADVVLLFDVLHYLPPEQQLDLLRRTIRALNPGGLLMLREAMSDCGLRFRLTVAGERICALARGHWRQRFHFRSRGAWIAMLREAGLETQSAPLWGATPYANVLVLGRKPG